YRNLLIYRGQESTSPFTRDSRATAPHDLTDKSVADDYPRGDGSDLLNDLMTRSVALFADHPVNVARRRAGKLPATNIWLWGLGRTPQLQ
ncbi:MAG: phosphoglycerate mutase, partial [Planctomycetes bacterium]|nr:phosphoglycerate mutase [Planctomycetota bacterium]